MLQLVVVFFLEFGILTGDVIRSAQLVERVDERFRYEHATILAEMASFVW